MRRAIFIAISILFSATIILGGLEQTERLTMPDGRHSGLLRATVMVYDQSTSGVILWAGTTDGTLPSLRIENGYIHNIDAIIPGYLKTGDVLWVEIRHDGRLLTESRIRYAPPTALRREMPDESGEITETLDDELRIGNPGLDEELYVASARTGFGIDAPIERVEIDGALGLKEGSPPTATTDFGKVYVDDGDGHLYYMDEDGTTTDLLETSSAAGGGNFLAAFEENMQHTCVGQDLWLNVHLAKGGEPYTHLWTGDTGPLSATNIPDPIFSTATPGLYRLVYTITDSDGNSSEYMLRIQAHDPVSPTITASPSSGGCTGEPVRLVATGCYEKYCWEEGPCTKVFDVTESGTYHLNVKDEWGCEASADYTVTFLPPPTVDPGTNVSVCRGTTDPSLGGSPSASGGTPPYFYEWTGTGIPYLSSTNVANPTFDADASVGVYNLTLEVIDGSGCSSISPPITVTIWENPTVSASSNSPVCLGNAINLTSSPSGGASPYNYSWTGPDGYTATAQSPTISSATLANGGTYTVIVTDDHGCVSVPANTDVTILNPPSISTAPSDLTRCEGESATFSVSATGDGLTYQWQVDTGSGYTNMAGETSTSVTISSVSYAMNGNIYRCIVSGTCSPVATSSGATLTVREPVNITTAPSDVTVCEDSPATFSVTASGYSLTYQWERSTDGGSSWGNLSGETSSSLTLTPPDDSWDGYRCRCMVTDGCGDSQTSAYALLNVDAKPEILTDPTDQTVDEGDPATFSVTALGTGVVYQWQQNTGSGWSNISGATLSDYTTPSTTDIMDGYQYRCIVSGACSPPDTSSAATLTVDTGLYMFTSHTFTNCGQTGRTGPNLSQCRSSYTTSWDDTYLTMSSTGIQVWTVPYTGNYRFEVAGASGGVATISGYGALVTGTVSLTEGTTVNILVGQMGSTHATSNSDGGGGGSFVQRGDGTLLFVAGGGAGAAQSGNSGNENASLTTSVVSSSASQFGSRGAGYSSNGVHFTHSTHTTVAQSFTSGGNGQAGGEAGGWPGADYGYGGFGGGGSSCSCSTGGGGGGGGYQGGGGGGGGYNSGYGGSSYIIGSATSTSSVLRSVRTHGYVEVTYIP